MKVIYSILFALSILIISSVEIRAQSFVSLSTGISVDLNNANHSFYHVPVTLQWKPFKQNHSPFFLEFCYDIPIMVKGPGNAFTLNPDLPKEVMLQENIRASIFTASIGFRIHLYTNKNSNSFYLNLLPFGVCAQNFVVSYKKYDKQNYEVLNPDVSLHSGGLVASMEAAYYFHKRKQDMVVMLHLQTPPLQSTFDYPFSYKFVAPLQLTFGYNFYYNKSK